MVNQILIPQASEENPHEYEAYYNGELIGNCFFTSLEEATQKAKEQIQFDSIVDVTEKWYYDIGEKYINRIKKLHPSFRKSGLVVDLTKMFYSRNPNDWYTFIPFTHKGTKWNYRETASGDWLEKVKEQD